MDDRRTLEAAVEPVPAFESGARLLGMLREKEISSPELLGVFLRRAERLNPLARPPFTLAHADNLYRKLLLGVFTVAVPAPSVFPHLTAAIPPRGSRLLRNLHMLGLTHGSWLGLNKARRRHQLVWQGFFERYDVLLTPVSPVAAPRHDHSHKTLTPLREMQMNGRTRPYLDQLIWAGLAGVALLPATSAPVGMAPEGLPVGIQIMRPRLEDHTPIRFAELLADIVGGFTTPPGYT